MKYLLLSTPVVRCGYKPTIITRGCAAEWIGLVRKLGKPHDLHGNIDAFQLRCSRLDQSIDIGKNMGNHMGKSREN